MMVFCSKGQFSFFELNGNKTFYEASSLPKVSECAQTMLMLVPSLFLFLFAPVLYYSMRKSQNGPVSKNMKAFSKSLISGLLVFLSLARLFLFAISLTIVQQSAINGHLNDFLPQKATATTQLISLGVQFVSLSVAFYFVLAFQWRGVLSSGTLFNFWFLLLLCGFSEARQKFGDISSVEQQDTLRFADSSMLLFFYLGSLIMFFLSCFADSPRFVRNDMKSCPEESVSFLNRITFWWFNGMARLGHRRDLTEADLWDLPARDRSHHLVAKFSPFREFQLKALRIKERQQHHLHANNLLVESGAHVMNVNKCDEEKLELSTKQQKKTKTSSPVIAPPSIIWPLARTFRWMLISGAFYKLIFDLLQFVSPYLLKLLIKFIEDRRQRVWVGLTIALAMFLIALLQSLLLHQYFHTMFRLGLNVRSILTSVVYKKALYLTNGARKTRTVGEIVNLMSVDIQRFQDITQFVMLFWSAPLQIILAVFFLWRLLGFFAVFAGILVLVALIPLNTRLSIIIRNYQQRQMETKDVRLKLLNEMLNGIKVVKLYAWEQPLCKKITEYRDKELRELRKLAYVGAGTALSWTTAPFLVAVLTFATYVLIDPEKNILTPEITFVGLTLFNILRFPLAVFAMIFGQAVQCVVSNRRLKEFLAEEEIEDISQQIKRGACCPYKSMPLSGDPELAIHLQNAFFSWEPDGDLVLKDINLSIKKGSLVAVVGQIGAGKSSLISAILGDMYKRGGSIERWDGSASYVPQQAWIQNATLRNNILFGQEFQKDRYERVLEACALLPDLSALPSSDQTEIGEKGINLSGGQKQRVSIARAIYSQHDFYVFDDPLSALDANVGKWIFEHVIGVDGVLSNRTRVLVTHSLSYLRLCDQIVVLRDGQVAAAGAYDTLLRTSPEFSTVIGEFLLKEIETTKRIEDERVGTILEELQKAGDPYLCEQLVRRLSELGSSSLSEQLSIDETKAQQQCSAKCPATEMCKRAEMTFPSNSAPHQPVMIARKLERQNDADPSQSREGDSLLPHKKKSQPNKSQVKSQRSVVGSFRSPSKSGGGPNRLIVKEQVMTGKIPFSVYLSYLRAIGWCSVGVFLFIQLGSCALGMASNFWLARWSDQASQQHASESQIRSDTISNLGIYATLGLSQALLMALGTVLIALAMVHAASDLHSKMLRDLFQSTQTFFDSTPLGRIVNRFSKDIDGVDTAIPRSLLAFVRTTLASLEILVMIALTVPTFIFAIIPLAAIYLYALRYYVSTSRQLKRLESTTRSPIFSHFQESIQGASSIRSYQAADRFLCDLQSLVDRNMRTYFPSLIANRWLAVRLELVGNLIVFAAALSAVWLRDKDLVTAGLIGLAISYSLSITQTLNWAVRMTGELETNIVSVERILEYSDTPKESQQTTDPGSAFTDADSWPPRGEIRFDRFSLRYRPELNLVLRDLTAHIRPGEKIGVVGRTGAGKSSLALGLFRLVEPASGTVFIDGVDITQLSLFDIRSSLTIIPQEPVLFSGTLRFNLDPFNRYSDERIWSALEQAHLRQFISQLPNGLTHIISEGGENISVGQRQLLCLARALLRRPRVLVLDEATASVDMTTDALIQETIRNEFRKATLITIAHRLNTILDYDRVLVLDAGEIKEFDAPQTLLSDPRSLFAGMASDSASKFATNGNEKVS